MKDDATRGLPMPPLRPPAANFYGAVLVISCQWGERISVETPPFFGNAATQRGYGILRSPNWSTF